MQKSAKIIIFILSVLTGSVAQAMVSGPIIREEIFASGRTDRQIYCWSIDEALYAAGGIAFTYPAGIFTAAPSVLVQVEELAPVAGTTYIATVSSNSITDVTVTVYKLSATLGFPDFLVEADVADNIRVYLYAVGPE